MRKRLAGRLSITMLVAALIVLSGFATSAGAAAGGQGAPRVRRVHGHGRGRRRSNEGDRRRRARRPAPGRERASRSTSYLTRSSVQSSARAGIKVKLTRVQEGPDRPQQFAAARRQNGFNVWRSWDEPGGIRDQMYEVAHDNPQLAKLGSAGTTYQGREILAIKLTQGARGMRDGSRPAVLYSSTQHAREWISTEVNRRLMNWYIERWRANDKRDQGPAQGDRALVRARRQPGRLPVHVRPRAAVAQEPARQQRRRRDHGRRRRRPEPQLLRTTSSTTRRAPPRSPRATPTAVPAPTSEPETQAMKGLLDRIGFEFQVNWHSAGQWLLYAEGWQIATPDRRRPDLLRDCRATSTSRRSRASIPA